MEFGIQTYGPRPLWQPDPDAYFRKISGMGYRYVEPCAAIPGSAEASARGFWSPEELERFHNRLAELGLGTPSVHIFTEDLSAALSELLRLAPRCGVRQYVLPCPQEVTEEGYLAYADACKACASALREAGVRLLLHNNGAEISAYLHGKTAYEFLLDACGGLVGAQPDVGWLAAGGQDPEAFLWRNEERVWALHYKDADLRNGCREVPVGQGELDLFACFQFARAHGIPQVVDMDACTLPDIENAHKLLSGMTFRRDRTSSVLCELDTETGVLTELHRFPGIIEAPNWLADGSILFNAEGKIVRYLPETDAVEPVDTGECQNCNNDHVPSPDGSFIAVSHSPEGEPSKIYIADPKTGETRLVTPRGPSYLHGWSPDGKELCYCAFRDSGGFTVDIYAIPASGGGEERRLTDGMGYNDGPEYAPDGKHIWFNSTRSGLMQVWRMDRDGGNLTQMTDSPANNWFPHVSPDGKKTAYLAFRQGDLEPHEHLPNMRVQLWLMDSDGTGKRKLLDFFGGQGSVNVNSWASDSRRLALVVYELEHR